MHTSLADDFEQQLLRLIINCGFPSVTENERHGTDNNHINPGMCFQLTSYFISTFLNHEDVSAASLSGKNKHSFQLFSFYLLNVYECTTEQKSPWDFFTFKFRSSCSEMTSEDLKNMLPLSFYLSVSPEREVYDGTASASLVPSVYMNLRAESSHTHTHAQECTSTFSHLGLSFNF